MSEQDKDSGLKEAASGDVKADTQRLDWLDANFVSHFGAIVPRRRITPLSPYKDKTVSIREAIDKALLSSHVTKSADATGVSSPPVEHENEEAWLIERGEACNPEYLAFRGWTTNPFKALRYTLQREAEFAVQLRNLKQVRICAHGFESSSPVAESAARAWFSGEPRTYKTRPEAIAALTQVIREAASVEHVEQEEETQALEEKETDVNAGDATRQNAPLPCPLPIPKALYSCSICREDYSWPAGDLFWPPKVRQWICRECYDEDGMGERGTSLDAEIQRRSDPDINELVNRFLAWPLPESVCSDQCATERGYPHRSGTTLLTADEARQMLEYILTPSVGAGTDLVTVSFNPNPIPSPSSIVEQEKKNLLGEKEA